ncbi:MAG TPA: sigma-70 family RNA polymerase sigma factor [Alphaproteobacteria bacterium]|nr:sigma-70 family RNA polymerase sigma factor [Alphaproteobacteria bacterium]
MPGDERETATRRARFEREMLPHLDAAYNLARWLLRDREDGADAAQEACLRAFKYFDGFRGGSAKAWLLRIVRNTCYDWRKANPRGESMNAGDGELSPEHERALEAAGPANPSPEAILIARADRTLVEESLAALPPEFREALVLREIEALSYREISEIAAIPIGTVMSRLARARSLLQRRLVAQLAEDK